MSTDTEDVQHSETQTKQLASAIRTALIETDTFEDVWESVTVDKPPQKPATGRDSAFVFIVEGEDELLYDVVVRPRPVED